MGSTDDGDGSPTVAERPGAKDAQEIAGSSEATEVLPPSLPGPGNGSVGIDNTFDGAGLHVLFAKVESILDFGGVVENSTQLRMAFRLGLVADFGVALLCGASHLCGLGGNRFEGDHALGFLNGKEAGLDWLTGPDVFLEQPLFEHLEFCDCVAVAPGNEQGAGTVDTPATKVAAQIFRRIIAAAIAALHWPKHILLSESPIKFF